MEQQTIGKITVVGAGAMGMFFGAKLASAGLEVQLIDAWQPQVDAIRSDGIHGEVGETPIEAHPPIFRPEEVKEPAELVILFVKSLQLEETLTSVRGILGERTQVLCLLNGVGHERILCKFVDPANLHLGVTVWAAGRTGPGTFHASAKGAIELQNYVDTPQAQAAAEALVDCLNQAELRASYSSNAKFSIWRKACVNGTSNALCTLLDTNLAGLYQAPQAEALLAAILDEFCRAAAYEGVELDPVEMNEYITRVSQGPSIRDHYPSMHQDLIQNHRLTEVDFLNGAIADILEEKGESARINRFVTNLLHAKESLLVEG